MKGKNNRDRKLNGNFQDLAGEKNGMGYYSLVGTEFLLEKIENF